MNDKRDFLDDSEYWTKKYTQAPTNLVFQNGKLIQGEINYDPKIKPMTNCGTGYLGVISQESCYNSILREYLPETCTVRSDLILKLIPLLESSLENTQDLLCQHDVSLGRTTKKNKAWAETLESEIKNLTDCIAELKLLGVSKPTHYS